MFQLSRDSDMRDTMKGLHQVYYNDDDNHHHCYYNVIQSAAMYVG